PPQSPLFPYTTLFRSARRSKQCVPMASEIPQPGATSSIEDQIRLREQKADQIREKGAHPYGNGVEVPHTTEIVRARHANDDAAADRKSTRLNSSHDQI